VGGAQRDDAKVRVPEQRVPMPEELDQIEPEERLLSAALGHGLHGDGVHDLRRDAGGRVVAPTEGPFPTHLDAVLRCEALLCEAPGSRRAADVARQAPRGRHQ